MAMKRIPIEDATATELCEFLTTSLGVPNLRPQAGKATLLQKMRDVFYVEEYIEIDEPDADDIQRIEPARSPPGKQRMCEIMIPSQEKPGGSDHVFLGVNGVGILIPRDQRVKIPWKYMHALDNAKKHVYKQNPDGSLILPPKEVHDYPFSIFHEDPPLPPKKAEDETRQEAA